MTGESVEIIKSKEAKVLIVFFGGIANGIGIPRFEFTKMVEDYNISKIFIRDFNQAWYFKGLQGITTNLDETEKYLIQQIKEIQATKVVFMGSSAGAFASLFFGTRLHNLVDEIHAFAPQIFIDNKNRLKFKDFRWTKQLFRINGLKLVDDDRKDLEKFFRKYPISDNLKINVYFSTHNKPDQSHLQKAKRIKGITIIQVESEMHNTAGALKKQGALENILKKIVSQ